MHPELSHALDMEQLVSLANASDDDLEGMFLAHSPLILATAKRQRIYERLQVRLAAALAKLPAASGSSEGAEHEPETRPHS